MSLLTVETLTAGYDDTTVLRDVNIEVGESSVVALLGPNGAGKTTTMRAIAGTIQPMSGRIIFGGEDITKMPAYRRARLGICYLPEGRGIFPSLSVRDNLILESPKGKRAETFDVAVGAFPILGKRMNQSAASLSGGEQQMLAFVRALVEQPRLVLVDEASMGLAPLLVNKVFEVLQQLVAQGAALLIVEQYVARALEMADHAYLLSHGRIVFDGLPSRLSEEDDMLAQFLGLQPLTADPA